MAGLTTYINPFAPIIEGPGSGPGGDSGYSSTDFLNDFATRSSDNLQEGPSNQYFTEDRFNDHFEIQFSEYTSDDLQEGGGNLFWSVARFDASFDGKVTDDLAEGDDNLYYSSERWEEDFESKTTDDLEQGTRNLYYSQPRFDNSMANATTDDLAEGDSNEYFTKARWNNVWATKSTDELSEGTANRFWSVALFDSAFAAKTTDQLAEGNTNLYQTPERWASQFDARTTDDLTEGTTNRYVTTLGRNAIEAHKLSVSVVLDDDTPTTGLFPVEGINLSVGTRVLVVGQSDQTRNGLFEAQAGPWTRSADALVGGQYIPGFVVAVRSGFKYRNTLWAFTNEAAPTLGTTELNFRQVIYQPCRIGWFLNGATPETYCEFANTPYPLNFGETARDESGLVGLGNMSFQNQREAGYFQFSAIIPWRRSTSSGTNECRLSVMIGGKETPYYTRHDLNSSMKVMNYNAMIFMEHKAIASYHLTNLEAAGRGYTAYDPHGFISRII